MKSVPNAEPWSVLAGWRAEPVSKLLDEVDGELDCVVRGALQDAVPGGLINSRELVEAPRPPLEELDVHLYRPARDQAVPPWLGSRPVPFLGHARDPVLLEDPQDGRRREEDSVGVESEEIAEPHGPVLPLPLDVEDKGLDLRGAPAGADRRAPRPISQPLDASLPVPAEPHIEPLREMSKNQHV